MDPHELTWTPDHLDRWFRTETSCDLLAGTLPRTRLVCFGRWRPLLAVHARAREPDEAWDEHICELLFLARSLRPTALALGITVRPTDLDAPDAHLTLMVTTGVRRLTGPPTIRMRAHPYVPGEYGLLDWLVPTDDDTPPPNLAALPRAALRRDRLLRRRSPRAVAAYLGSLGHQLDAAPAAASRLHLPGHASTAVGRLGP